MSLLMLAAAAQAPLLWQVLRLCYGSQGQPDDALTAIAVHLGLALTVAAAFGRLRNWLPIITLAALLGPAEAFYLGRFGLPSGPHLYGVIAETDWREVNALLGAWLIPLSIAATAYVTLVALAARRVWAADLRWRHRSRWWLLMAATAMAAFMAWGEKLVLATEGVSALNVASEDQTYLERPVTGVHQGLLLHLEAAFPWGLPFRAHRYLEYREALAEHLSRRKSFRFDLRWLGSATRKPAVHVFVIGETARADHWSLFGYGRDTTPELRGRNDAAELIVFNDAVSAASATRESVPLMLTRRPAKQPLKPTGEPSVLTAFSQAGFKTFWLSAQGTAGIHETPVSVLAGEADEQRFINQADYQGPGALDGSLLPVLAQAINDPSRQKFIVLHTLGSHLNYAHRYPADFERFKPALRPDDQPDVWRRASSEALKNAYDNSVLYTDHVLEQIIRLVEQTGVEATVTYASDHGESLFDGRCQQGGHGFAAVANYHVPMFIWASPAWRSSNADAWQRLRSRQEAAVTTLAMFPTLTALAGFESDLPGGPKALGAPDWSPFPRAVAHFVDFDGFIRTKGCDAPLAKSP